MDTRIPILRKMIKVPERSFLLKLQDDLSLGSFPKDKASGFKMVKRSIFVVLIVILVILFYI